MIQYMKLGLNPSFGSRDRVRTSLSVSKFDFQSAEVILKMRRRSAKSNYSYCVPLSQRRFCASLVKIHTLLKIERRQDSFYSLNSVVDLKIGPRSTQSNQIV